MELSGRNDPVRLVPCACPGVLQAPYLVKGLSRPDDCSVRYRDIFDKLGAVCAVSPGFRSSPVRVVLIAFPDAATEFIIHSGIRSGNIGLLWTLGKTDCGSKKRADR